MSEPIVFFPEPCAHPRLARIDDSPGVYNFAMGVYQCDECGALLLFPAQGPIGMRDILVKAAAWRPPGTNGGEGA